MTNSRKPRVAVIGGSIAGVSVGIALRCLGCEVQRAVPYNSSRQGGGLVVQYEILDWRSSHGIAALAK